MLVYQVKVKGFYYENHKRIAEERGYNSYTE